MYNLICMRLCIILQLLLFQLLTIGFLPGRDLPSIFFLPGHFRCAHKIKYSQSEDLLFSYVMKVFIFIELQNNIYNTYIIIYNIYYKILNTHGFF